MPGVARILPTSNVVAVVASAVAVVEIVVVVVIVADEGLVIGVVAALAILAVIAVVVVVDDFNRAFAEASQSRTTPAVSTVAEAVEHGLDGFERERARDATRQEVVASSTDNDAPAPCQSPRGRLAR